MKTNATTNAFKTVERMLTVANLEARRADLRSRIQENEEEMQFLQTTTAAMNALLKSNREKDAQIEALQRELAQLRNGD